MIDKVNPNSQFHPYQPPDTTPQTEKLSGLSGMRGKLGFDQSKIDALGSRMRGVDLNRVRTMARNNGGLVLGSLAALVIGAGLLRKRRSMTPRV